MLNFNTELTKALLEKQDLNEFFREQLEQAMNNLLQAELSSVLGYEPYERSSSLNARNGQYSRSFDTRYGKLNLVIPRDRQGQFHQHLIPDYERRSDRLEETVIQLYSKGVTTREISDLIEKMYGSYYSPATISNLTVLVDEQVQAFHARQLESNYAFIYLDATYLPLRRDSVAKEPVHLALGITASGKKEILGYVVSPTENLSAYEELLEQLKGQGLTQVLMFLTDGFRGIEQLILKHFPHSKHQHCLVHLSRNCWSHARVSHRDGIADDFKTLYQSDSKEEAQLCLEVFISK